MERLVGEMLGGGGGGSGPGCFGVSGDDGPVPGDAGDGDGGDAEPASADELYTFLKQYTAMGGSLDPTQAPPELGAVLKSLADGAGGADVLREMLVSGGPGATAFAAAMGSGGGGSPSNANATPNATSGTKPVPPVDREEIFPESGFVIKTVDDGGRKVFINVCGHFKIQQPGSEWANGQVPANVETALANLEDPDSVQHLRFPLSVSDPRNELDKKGTPCTVYDAVFNTDVVKQAMVTRRLKVFLVELVLQWIGQKYKSELDAQYKLPHRRYVGPGEDAKPVSQWIRVDKKSMIEEIDEPDEEVVFPLRPRRSEKQVREEAAAREAKVLEKSGVKKKTSANEHEKVARGELGKSNAGGASFAFDSLPEVAYALRFSGKPVTAVLIDVAVPPNVAVENVKVHVVTEAVLLAMPGHKQTRVVFPFAVRGESGSCVFDRETRLLTFQAAYVPYAHLVQTHKEKGALAVGSGALGKLGSSFLEI